MIVDSSAIVAVLMEEADAPFFEGKLATSPISQISTATYVELINVVDRRASERGVQALDRLFDRAGIELVPFDIEQAHWARHARLTYGVGRHPANLNFGDCFAYALAKATGEPLLFKGNDFSHTDVVPVGPSP